MFLIIYGCQSTFLNHESAACPNGLTPIPPMNPTYCIQPFESKIHPEGHAMAQKGQVPDVNVSLLDAMKACSETTIDGQSLRLASLQEWQDAGDGRIGKGGFSYPWGNERADHRCVLDSPDNPGVWEAVQPSGSLEACVGINGVYDQIGNAWEWVDLQQTANRADWIALIEQHGMHIKVSESAIEMESRLLARVRLQTICVDLKQMSLQSSQLTVQLNDEISDHCESGGKGYLWVNFTDRRHQQGQLPQKGSLLPIKLQDNMVVWDKDRDGEAVGAKVGDLSILVLK